MDAATGRPAARKTRSGSRRTPPTCGRRSESGAPDRVAGIRHGGDLRVGLPVAWSTGDGDRLAEQPAGQHQAVGVVVETRQVGHPAHPAVEQRPQRRLAPGGESD